MLENPAARRNDLEQFLCIRLNLLAQDEIRILGGTAIGF
jgi:hypothetical protein